MCFYQSSQFRTVSAGMAEIFRSRTPLGTGNTTETYLLIFRSVLGSTGRSSCVSAEKIISGQYMFYTDLSFSPSISPDLLRLLFFLSLSDFLRFCCCSFFFSLSISFFFNCVLTFLSFLLNCLMATTHLKKKKLY